MDRRIPTDIAAGGQYRVFQATVLGANAGEFLRNRRDEVGAFFHYRCISLVDALGSGHVTEKAAARSRGAEDPVVLTPTLGLVRGPQ